MKCYQFCILLLTVSFMCRFSFANSDDKQAKALFIEGTTLYSEGNYQEASLRFRRAYELKPAWKLWFNIGQAEAASKHYGLALEAFEKYLSLGGDEVNRDRFDEVIGEMQRLRQLVGNLEVEGAPEGALIRIDGVERATLPVATPLRISTGVQHDVEIYSDNQLVFSQKVTVGSAATATIKVETQERPNAKARQAALQDATGSTLGYTSDATMLQNEASDEVSPNGTPAQMSTDSVRRSARLPLKIAFLSSVGLTVVSGALAIAFWRLGGNKEDELNSLNERQNDIPADEYLTKYNDTLDSMERFDRLSTAMLITTGVLTATSVALLIVWRKKKQPSSSISGLSNRFRITF